MPRPGTSGGGHRSSGGHSSSRVGGGHHVGRSIMDIEEMFILVLQVV